jgi:single-strand DNA-binding protein
MAKSINKVILVGNLGKDPEVRTFESGGVKASFPLATSETYKDKTTGETKTQTDWHNIVLWKGLAEVAQNYLKKGMQIYVEGKLRTRSYQDKDGNNKYITEIVGENLVMMGKGSNATSESSPSEEPGSFIPEAEGTDDLPF